MASLTGRGRPHSTVPNLDQSNVARLSIVDSTGTSITLQKTADGWVLPEAGDYPALEVQVTGLLTKVMDLDTSRLVAQTRDSHKRLKVADTDFERQVSLVLEDGSNQQFYVGSSPSFGAGHIRPAGQDAVYVSTDLSTQDASVAATAWVERTYFQLPNDQVRDFTLENINGRFVFSRVEETWAMEDIPPGDTLDQARVESFLSRATSVALVQPLGRENRTEYGLDQPAALLTFHAVSETEGEQTITLAIGTPYLEDGSYPTSVSTSPFVVLVSSFTGDSFTDQTQEDFLVPQPTPTPGTAP